MPALVRLMFPDRELPDEVISHGELISTLNQHEKLAAERNEKAKAHAREMQKTKRRRTAKKRRR